MYMRITLTTIFLSLLTMLVHAQSSLAEWQTEAESKDTKVTNLNDGTIDIIAPEGITLWYKKKMTGNTVIEYDAQIVVENNRTEAWNRLSDLNCFWMATDPDASNGSPLAKAAKRKGIFINQYALRLYYMGYGGNYNSTTRFRRYDGNAQAVSDKDKRPAILREYTDANHLLKANHWYHVRLEQTDGHVRYTIDGNRLVDYVDINPLTEGYFGFRTTRAHAQLKNFRFKCSPSQRTPITLHWLDGKKNVKSSAQTFGIPFAQGELKADERLTLTTSKGETLQCDSWPLALWPDGSIKWNAFSALIPAQTDSCRLTFTDGTQKKNATYSPKHKNSLLAKETDNQIIISTGTSQTFIAKTGEYLVDSITRKDLRSVGKIWLEANGRKLRPSRVVLEQNGNNHAVVKIDGDCFTLRLYAYRGIDEIKVVHTLLVDSTMNTDGLHSLGLRMNIPFRSENHLRTISFNKGDTVPALSRSKTCRDAFLPMGDGTSESPMHRMQVKPLIARRPITVDEEGNIEQGKSTDIASSLASWDGFRLSQLSPNAFSIRKRATASSPWIGTIEGYRAPGQVVLSDKKVAVSLTLTDFWQSYPSTLQVDNARSDEATASLWMWSPEAEAMSFEHYDTIAHTLEAAYEDVQPGMSTAYGIARTSTLYIYLGTPDSLSETEEACHTPLLPTPQYLHSKRAFGIWSLPTDDEYEKTLSATMDTYACEQERNGWYGYFNYGDVMHSYDHSRGEWRYDVGGYAWDNTELASNAMFWYNFLRTGNPDIWRMAVAMTRHTAEVDCYHQGPHCGLGSRHNVSHWGCGAKEARISQAFWNRFYYYLTADERAGDLMHEVVDADTLLYTLDPMRLAQPRSDEYPCTAPARLRIGPDWLAYAGNWFCEWERTGNMRYYEKILTGMKSIAAMPHGIFSGPKALGYDPSTGIISWEGDSNVQHTNHLMTIMGGFEMMNEMMLSIDCKEWNDTWLSFTEQYKEKALELSGNKFRIPRLQGYAYWKTGLQRFKDSALKDMQKTPFSNKEYFFTNDAATWNLDAIFLLEVTR